MTLSELILAARSRLDDKETPYLWTDAELTAWLNEAEQEAALRGRLLRATYDVPVTINQSTYDLESDVFYVSRVRLVTLERILPCVSRAWLDDRYSDFETTTGDPNCYFIEERQLVLYPCPETADTLRYSALRLPIGMTASSHSPELHERMHLNLLEWVMYRAGQKRDTDSILPNPEQYLANFARVFGPPVSYELQRSWLEAGGTGDALFQIG